MSGSLLAKQVFYRCSCSQKYRSARHVRECSQRPFVIPFRSFQGHFTTSPNVFSLHDPVFKSLSSAIKEAIFGKSLLVYLESIRQVAKIHHAQGQVEYNARILARSFFFVQLQTVFMAERNALV